MTKTIKNSVWIVIFSILILGGAGTGLFFYISAQRVGVKFTPIDDDVYNNYNLTSQITEGDNLIYNYNLNISLDGLDIENIATIVSSRDIDFVTGITIENNEYRLSVINSSSEILQHCDFKFICYDVESYTSTFEIIEKNIVDGNYIVDISITIIPNIIVLDEDPELTDSI